MTKRGGGRVTPRGQRRRIHETHLLPIDIGMRRELIDGKDCILVEFEMPNAAINVPLTVEHWRDFCKDIEQIATKGRQHEHSDRQETKSGLVLPGTEDVIEHGGVPGLRK